MKHTFDDFKKFRELLTKLPYTLPPQDAFCYQDGYYSIRDFRILFVAGLIYSIYLRDNRQYATLINSPLLLSQEKDWLNYFINHAEDIKSYYDDLFDSNMSDIVSKLKCAESYTRVVFDPYRPFITNTDYLEFGIDNLDSPTFNYFYLLILAWLYDEMPPKRPNAAWTQEEIDEDLLAKQRDIVKTFLAMTPVEKKETALSKIFESFNQINRTNIWPKFSLSYNKVLHCDDVPLTGKFFVTWDKVLFFDKYYFIYHPSFPTGENGMYPLKVDDVNSRKAFNDIQPYFMQRLGPIYVEAKNGHIKKALNPQHLSDCIALMEQKISAPQKEKKIDIPENNLKKELNKSIAKNIIKEFKSKFLNYLCGRQLDDFNVVYCIENRINANNVSAEYAFIFTIKEHGPYLTLAFENSHDSRCTYLFTVPKRDWNKAINEIYDFFASDAVNKRASLAKRIVDLRLPGNFDYRRVMHSDYLKWADNIKFGSSFK